MKHLRMTAALAVMMMAVPAQAYGAPRSAEVVPQWLSIAVGFVGLVISLALLLNVHSLRNVAGGSMLADNIHYVMLAVLCLAASMIARWVGIFSTDETVTQQVSLAGDVLVTVGMALIGVYFFRVRSAMNKYLKAAKDLARAAEAGPNEDGAHA